MRVSSRIDKYRKAARLALRPESRLLLTVLASVSSLALSDTLALSLLLAFSLLYLVEECGARLIFLAYAFLAVMMAVCLGFVWVLGFVFEPMRDAPMTMATSPFLRLGVSLNVILPLAMNVKLTNLAAALGGLRLPGIIRLPLMVTIRFIPTILNDLRQLNEAVGIRFRGKKGFFFWLARPLTWWRVFFYPLVVRLIRSADELAMAAELKGLDPGTKFGDQKEPFSADDRLLVMLAVLAVALAAAAQLAAPPAPPV
ncbi:MAG: energy-coupling factor transporter transmembrane protein EcfT [Deltaproteobacteria bacterium]|jgi:energy-coupling factor transport system permease protein|nr:energy-coupling factor transporter transmembrane protein EcfT [Deltaproteobacteria bacterium]